MKILAVLFGLLGWANVDAQVGGTSPAPMPSAPPGAVAAPAASVDIEFLVDASGSMSAVLGNESQMESAKRAVKQAVGTIPPHVPVALRVYAHRVPKSDKEGSCRDTELLVPFQPVNPAAFAAVVDGLKANGWTPIAHSLKATAADFSGREAQHVIILLSDGEETCGGDPVAEVRNLLAQGFKVTVHTIGFRVDANTRAQLAAISAATGGSYYDAADAASLARNLSDAAQKALLISKPAEQARGREIRGGNQYQDAVPLEPGIECRLDHHQRKDQFDYFFVDLKKGQALTVTVATLDRGILVGSSDQARENDLPYAGFRVMNVEFKQVARGAIIGSKHGEDKANLAPRKADERLYLLIGSEYAAMHKDSPFRIEVKSYFDAGSGRDAGNDAATAVELALAEYPENWLTDSADGDWYKLSAKAGESWSFVVTPQGMDLGLKLAVFDRDRVKMKQAVAPNAGAVVRIEGIAVKADGPLYLQVGASQIRGPSAYGLGISKTPQN